MGREKWVLGPRVPSRSRQGVTQRTGGRAWTKRCVCACLLELDYYLGKDVRQGPGRGCLLLLHEAQRDDGGLVKPEAACDRIRTRSHHGPGDGMAGGRPGEGL
jgi:hypothetical protein